LSRTFFTDSSLRRRIIFFYVLYIHHNVAVEKRLAFSEFETVSDRNQICGDEFIKHAGMYTSEQRAPGKPFVHGRAAAVVRIGDGLALSVNHLILGLLSVKTNVHDYLPQTSKTILTNSASRPGFDGYPADR
jgi:hypothetical protein